MKFTESSLRKLACSPGNTSTVRYITESPSIVTGFGIRITPAGSISFVLRYKRHGHNRTFSIGTWPTFKVAEARQEARRLRQAVELGADPHRQRQAVREAPDVAELVAEYRRLHLPNKRPKSQREDRRLLDKHIVPELGHLKLADLSARDVQLLHASLRDTPHQANRVVSLVSKLLSLAVKWEWCARNVAANVERYPEQPRARYLTTDELERLSDALAASKSPVAADIVRLLLLTGARFGEVASMRWVDVDLDAGTWSKPASSTKQQRAHVVPLSAAAVEVLKERTRDDVHVFGNVRSIKTAWATITKNAGLDGVRLHDLRHSFAAQLASDGASLPLIGRLLGHSTPVVTQRYAHLLDAPLRDAVERVARKVK